MEENEGDDKLRLTIGKRDHLTKNFAIGLDSESYEILASLGFKDIGDLVDCLERQNEVED